MRAAFGVMRTDAARARSATLAADDRAGQRLRRICARALSTWSAAAKRANEDRERRALASAAWRRSSSLAAFSHWRLLPVLAEREMHMMSLARSFHSRRLAHSTLHQWSLAAQRANAWRLKSKAAMPGSAEGKAAAAEELRAAPSESDAAARATAALERTLRDFLGSRRRAAAVELGRSAARLSRRRRYRATSADLTWISLMSPHMQRLRSEAAAAIEAEDHAKKGAKAVAAAASPGGNGDGGGPTSAAATAAAGEAVDASIDSIEPSDAARAGTGSGATSSRAALYVKIFEVPGWLPASTGGGASLAPASRVAPDVPPPLPLSPTSAAVATAAAASDEVAARACNVAARAAADSIAASAAVVTARDAAETAATRAAAITAEAAQVRLSQARQLAVLDAESANSRGGDEGAVAETEARWAAANARAKALASSASSIASDAETESRAAVGYAAAVTALAAAAAILANDADAAAITHAGARAAATAASTRSKAAAADVAKWLAAEIRQRQLAADAEGATMHAPRETVEALHLEADASKREAADAEVGRALRSLFQVPAK